MNWFQRFRDTILFKVFVVTFIAWLSSMSIGVFIALKTEKEMNLTNESTLLANSNMVRSMLQAIQLTMNHNINRISQRLTEYMAGNYDLEESKVIRIGEIDTPELRLNGRTLNLNFDIVDRLTKETGAVATIFAKKGDDFVRVTTSLKKEDNTTRAIGTLLGKDHPAFNFIMRGEDYIGRAFLFGRDYMTKYMPIKKNGKIIGILFVGIDFTSEMKETVNSIKGMRVGSSGTFFIVDGNEKNFGKLIVHSSLEGKNILNLKTPNGDAVVDKETLKSIFTLGEGKHLYSWIDDKGNIKEKMAVYSVFKEWKWGIAVSVFVEEFQRDSARVKWLLIASMWMMNILITSAVIFAVYRSVTKPAALILDSLNRVSGGDLTVSINVDSKDEIGKLSEGFNNMTSSLRSIIKNILASSDNASTMVDALKQNASNTVEQVKVQTQQADSISANSGEMSKTIGDIAANAEVASNTASKSVETADRGLSVAEQAVSTIAKVNESTVELAQIVEGLERRSTEISDIVVVIKDIADQTNLLALNAAIEAARAGEQGRGFAVVADEVRKLAEKTIHATKEISSKINSIQEEVHRTKESMEMATSEVSSATGFIDNVGNVLKEIVGSIEESKEQMTRIAAAVVEQSATTEEVARNINATATISREVEGMAVNTMQQADNLLEIIKKLKETSSGFKV